MRGRCPVLIFTAILLFQYFLSAEIINYSDLPTGISIKKTGRSVKLTEVMRITDYKGDFIFRNIRGIQEAEDGSVYVRCRDYLYKFTPGGEYVRNFITKGEGPGEVKHFVNFQVTADSVWIGAIYPVKLIRFSTEGEMKEEVTVHEIGNFSVFGGIWDRPYFIRQEQDIRNSKSGIIKEKHTLYHLDPGNLPVNTGITFTTKNLMLKESSKNGTRILLEELTHLLHAYDGQKKLYLSESERYGIYLTDLKRKKVIKQFSRGYEPVKYVKKSYSDKLEAELHSLYDRGFYNDIYKLMFFNGKLLVFTSTMNDKGEVLVDVFSSDGAFEDHFYLKLPGVTRPDDLESRPVHLKGRHLWTIDMDEDEVPFILKYRINGM